MIGSSPVVLSRAPECTHKIRKLMYCRFGNGKLYSRKLKANYPSSDRCFDEHRRLT